MERETFDVKIEELKNTYEHSLATISQVGKLDDETVQQELNELEKVKSKMYAKLEDVVCHAKSEFNENHLRPCPMLENPERLRKLVEETGAVNTDYQSPETADHLCSKCDDYAKNWAPVAEKLWEEEKELKKNR